MASSRSATRTAKQKDGNPHIERRGVPASYPAAYYAEGIQAGAQFRLSAPEQQTGQTGADDQAGVHSAAPTAPGGELRMLRQADADRAHAGEVR